MWDPLHLPVEKSLPSMRTAPTLCVVQTVRSLSSPYVLLPPPAPGGQKQPVGRPPGPCSIHLLFEAQRGQG